MFCAQGELGARYLILLKSENSGTRPKAAAAMTTFDDKRYHGQCQPVAALRSMRRQGDAVSEIELEDGRVPMDVLEPEGLLQFCPCPLDDGERRIAHSPLGKVKSCQQGLNRSWLPVYMPGRLFDTSSRE